MADDKKDLKPEEQAKSGPVAGGRFRHHRRNGARTGPDACRVPLQHQMPLCG